MADAMAMVFVDGVVEGAQLSTDDLAIDELDPCPTTRRRQILQGELHQDLLTFNRDLTTSESSTNIRA